MSQRHPLHCIIPPFMLESIAERGSPEQQAFARHCLDASARLRSERASAASAALASAGAATTPGKQRIVYSANGGTSLPGRAVRSEGDGPTGDAAADEAFDGSGATYDLYHELYGRDSIDGTGLRLDSTVHYGRGYDNAFWDGRQMVYGDGDEDMPPNQRLFNRFTSSLDVIAHELTHGVTQFTANLVYQGQSGALNEHFSDVFGVLVKQWQLRQAARDADWLIGSELLTVNVQGDAIRSMKAPGTAYDDPVLGQDPQPAHMRDYVDTTQDNGGVHINSGIPNYAFYRIALELGGHAWETAGQIWYRTLTSGRLGPNAVFQDVVDLTADIARSLYGADSVEHRAVAAGWAAAGLSVAAAPADPAPPPDPGTPSDPSAPSAPQPRGCNPLFWLWPRSGN